MFATAVHLKRRGTAEILAAASKTGSASICCAEWATAKPAWSVAAHRRNWHSPAAKARAPARYPSSPLFRSKQRGQTPRCCPTRGASF